MDAMEDENCSMQFQQVYNENKSSEDLLFDQIISQLQEIVIDPYFEKMLTQFMKNHWGIFDQNSTKQQQIQVFEAFKHQLKQHIIQNMTNKMPQFNWQTFSELFQTRKNLVDEQILDTLLSLQDVQNFKLFIKDYKNSYEQVEMFKVLTIKSNKISQNKKVKGKDNIFASDNNNMGIFDKNLKPPAIKKKPVIQKSQQQLLVPDLILTIKPMRKG